MPFYRKRGYSKRSRPTKGRPKKVLSKRRGAGLVRSFKAYVDKVVRRNIENKVQNIENATNIGNYLNSATLYSYPITPYAGFMTIGQGVTQNTRVGNVIRTRRVTLNYVLRPNAYNAVSNAGPAPFEIDMFLGYVKQSPGELPTAGDFNNLFQNGSSAVGPVGNLSDLIASVNKDYWTIKKRWRHKVGFSNNSGTGTNVSYQSFSNNDFKLNVVKKLDITRHVPKIIKWNDGVTTPTSRGLFFFFQLVSSAGNVLAGTQQPGNIEYWVEFNYEDA